MLARTALLASLSRPVCGFWTTAGRSLQSSSVALLNSQRTVGNNAAIANSQVAVTSWHHVSAPPSVCQLGVGIRSTQQQQAPKLTQRWMSSNGGEEITLTHIGREEMEEILEDVEHGGREDSGYVVIDVRNSDELAVTGTLGPNTYHLPLPVIIEQNVFTMEEDAFFDLCGFEKPTPDETLVFSCAAGMRSVYAARFAAQAGYGKLVNYKGGANEWFSSRR